MGLRSRADARRGRDRTPDVPYVDVEIDELLLLGFDGADRVAVGDAVRDRLVGLLGSTDRSALVRAGPGQERVMAPEVAIAQRAAPASIGQAIAGAVRDAIEASDNPASREARDTW